MTLATFEMGWRCRGHAVTEKRVKLDTDDETGKSLLLEEAKLAAKAHEQTCTLSKMVTVGGKEYSRIYWWFARVAEEPTDETSSDVDELP